jgi:hypothetical protein
LFWLFWCFVLFCFSIWRWEFLFQGV